jgi:RNA polymerase sigma-70 factor (ECF subfamily)
VSDEASNDPAAGDGPSVSDQDLLRRARSGDRSALQALLARHMDWLRAYVGRRMHQGLRRELDSTDAVQDVLLGALRSDLLRQASDPDHFRALLAKAAERDLIDRVRHARRARRDRRREQSMHGDTSFRSRAPVDSGTRPSQAAIRGERMAWIRLAMHRLSPSDRELLELRVWRGLGFDAIGDRLDLAPDAARMRVNRALARLARAVEALKGRGEAD